MMPSCSQQASPKASARASHAAAHVRTRVQDCIEIRKGPYEPGPAQAMLDEVLRTPEPQRPAAVNEALHRFFHKGQLVRLEGITGPVAYRNGRVGLILHSQQDEEGRYTVELNEFDRKEAKDIVQAWIRLPPTMLRVQVGMVPGLFFDFKFEKATLDAGIPLPCRNKTTGKMVPTTNHPGMATWKYDGIPGVEKPYPVPESIRKSNQVKVGGGE